MGGGSRNEKSHETSADPDLLFFILDLSEGMRIYTNTPTKKTLKDIVVHYQPFTHTLLLLLKQSWNIRNLSCLKIMYKK